MYLRLAKRLLLETDKRLLWKLAWNMGLKGMRSVQKHKARLKRGEFFPPFLYVSIINSCNLRCQGCWVDVAAKQSTIDAGGHAPADQRSQGDGQLVLRHPRRRAVHAPGAARDPRQPPRLLLPGLHQRPLHHRRSGQASCASSATSRR